MKSWYNSQTFVNLKDSSFAMFSAELSHYFKTKTCQYPQIKINLCCKYVIKGISWHFGIENYVWRVCIVQNLCEYCRLFCSTFCARIVSILPTHILLLIIPLAMNSTLHVKTVFSVVKTNLFTYGNRHLFCLEATFLTMDAMSH